MGANDFGASNALCDRIVISRSGAQQWGGGCDYEWFPGLRAEHTDIRCKMPEQFMMEGNTFPGKPNHVAPSGDWANFGTVVANTDGTQYNSIYLNTIGDSLTFGIYSLGQNRHGAIPYGTGVFAECNALSKNFTVL